MVSLFQDCYIVSSQEETRDLSVRCRINATIEKCTVWLLWGCPHAYHIKEKDRRLGFDCPVLLPPLNCSIV